MLSMLRHPLHQLRLGSESESANFKLVAQSQSVATKTNGLADAERWGDSAPLLNRGGESADRFAQRQTVGKAAERFAEPPGAGASTKPVSAGLRPPYGYGRGA